MCLSVLFDVLFFVVFRLIYPNLFHRLISMEIQCSFLSARYQGFLNPASENSKVEHSNREATIRPIVKKHENVSIINSCNSSPNYLPIKTFVILNSEVLHLKAGTNNSASL